MNTFESILDLVHKDCFMTSIDLKDAYHVLVAEAVVRRCSVKKMLLKISQDSQKNTCVRVSFLIELQASGLQLYQKRDPGTGVFL